MRRSGLSRQIPSHQCRQSHPSTFARIKSVFRLALSAMDLARRLAATSTVADTSHVSMARHNLILLKKILPLHENAALLVHLGGTENGHGLSETTNLEPPTDHQFLPRRIQ